MGDILKTAREYCDQHQLRLTPPRQMVLDILCHSDRPMGAYDVLAKLAEKIDNPKPPTAYRAIDFWCDHGFVHRIESLNAYVTCCDDHKHHDTHFLVCQDCHAVTEIHESASSRPKKLPDGFVAKKTVTETHGLCGECAP